MPDLKPTPLSVETYQQLATSPAYEPYLAHRQKQREANSSATDPSDGGPTDEAILSEYLQDSR